MFCKTLHKLQSLLSLATRGGPAAPLKGPENVRQEKDDEVYLADEGRWENMGTPKEKKTQKHCSLDPKGSLDCTVQCDSKEEMDRHVNKKKTYDYVYSVSFPI